MRAAVASSIAREHFGSRLSSTRESAGKMTTESRPAAMSAAALAGVTTSQREADGGGGDDERQRRRLHEHRDGHALARDDRAIEQRRQPAHDQQRGEEDRDMQEGRGVGGERVEVVLDARGDEEDRDEDPEAGGLELAPEVGVGHRAVAVDERDDRAGDERAEDDLEPQLGGQRHEPDEQDEGGADADLRGGVLQAAQDLAQPPRVLDAARSAARRARRPRTARRAG